MPRRPTQQEILHDRVRRIVELNPHTFEGLQSYRIAIKRLRDSCPFCAPGKSCAFHATSIPGGTQ